jgi:hypothetical protein
MTLFRRFFAAVACLLLLFARPAMACSSLKQPTDQELFANAASVFRARVTEVKLASLVDPEQPSRTVEVVEARYEVKEVFKGAPPASGIVRDLPYGPGNCSLGLLPGMEYVFFPGKYEMVLLFSGSFAFFNAEAKEIKQRLEELRGRAGAMQ